MAGYYGSQYADDYRKLLEEQNHPYKDLDDIELTQAIQRKMQRDGLGLSDMPEDFQVSVSRINNRTPDEYRGDSALSVGIQEFGKGLQSGWETTKGGYKAMVGLGAGALGYDEAEQEWMDAARENFEEASKVGSTMRGKGYDTLFGAEKDAGAIGRYLASGAGEALASTADLLASLLVGGGVGTAVKQGMVSAAKKKAMADIAARGITAKTALNTATGKAMQGAAGAVGKQAGAVAGATTAFGTSTGQNTGHVYSDLYKFTQEPEYIEQDGAKIKNPLYMSPEEARKTSILAGTASGSLDAVVPAVLISGLSKKIGMPKALKSVTSFVEKMPAGSVFSKHILPAAGVGAAESLTEAAQGFIQRAVVKEHKGEDWDLTPGSEDFKALFEEGFLGFLGGAQVKAGFDLAGAGARRIVGGTDESAQSKNNKTPNQEATDRGEPTPERNNEEIERAKLKAFYDKQQKFKVGDKVHYGLDKGVEFEVTAVHPDGKIDVSRTDGKKQIFSRDAGKFVPVQPKEETEITPENNPTIDVWNNSKEGDKLYTKDGEEFVVEITSNGDKQLTGKDSIIADPASTVLFTEDPNAEDTESKPIDNYYTVDGDQIKVGNKIVGEIKYTEENGQLVYDQVLYADGDKEIADPARMDEVARKEIRKRAEEKELAVNLDKEGNTLENPEVTEDLETNEGILSALKKAKTYESGVYSDMLTDLIAKAQDKDLLIGEELPHHPDSAQDEKLTGEDREMIKVFHDSAIEEAEKQAKVASRVSDVTSKTRKIFEGWQNLSDSQSRRIKQATYSHMVRSRPDLFQLKRGNIQFTGKVEGKDDGKRLKSEAAAKRKKKAIEEKSKKYKPRALYNRKDGFVFLENFDEKTGETTWYNPQTKEKKTLQWDDTKRIQAQPYKGKKFTIENGEAKYIPPAPKITPPSVDKELKPKIRSLGFYERKEEVDPDTNQKKVTFTRKPQRVHKGTTIPVKLEREPIFKAEKDYDVIIGFKDGDKEILFGDSVEEDITIDDETITIYGLPIFKGQTFSRDLINRFNSAVKPRLPEGSTIYIKTKGKSSSSSKERAPRYEDYSINSIIQTLKPTELDVVLTEEVNRYLFTGFDIDGMTLSQYLASQLFPNVTPEDLSDTELRQELKDAGILSTDNLQEAGGYSKVALLMMTPEGRVVARSIYFTHAGQGKGNLKDFGFGNYKLVIHQSQVKGTGKFNPLGRSNSGNPATDSFTIPAGDVEGSPFTEDTAGRVYVNGDNGLFRVIGFIKGNRNFTIGYKSGNFLNLDGLNLRVEQNNEQAIEYRTPYQRFLNDPKDKDVRGLDGTYNPYFHTYADLELREEAKRQIKEFAKYKKQLIEHLIAEETIRGEDFDAYLDILSEAGETGLIRIRDLDEIETELFSVTKNRKGSHYKHRENEYKDLDDSMYLIRRMYFSDKFGAHNDRSSASEQHRWYGKGSTKGDPDTIKTILFEKGTLPKGLRAQLKKIYTKFEEVFSLRLFKNETQFDDEGVAVSMKQTPIPGVLHNYFFVEEVDKPDGTKGPRFKQIPRTEEEYKALARKIRDLRSIQDVLARMATNSELDGEILMTLQYWLFEAKELDVVELEIELEDMLSTAIGEWESSLSEYQEQLQNINDELNLLQDGVLPADDPLLESKSQIEFKIETASSQVAMLTEMRDGKTIEFENANGEKETKYFPSLVEKVNPTSQYFDPNLKESVRNGILPTSKEEEVNQLVTIGERMGYTELSATLEKSGPQAVLAHLPQIRAQIEIIAESMPITMSTLDQADVINMSDTQLSQALQGAMEGQNAPTAIGLLLFGEGGQFSDERKMDAWNNDLDDPEGTSLSTALTTSGIDEDTRKQLGLVSALQDGIDDEGAGSLGEDMKGGFSIETASSLEDIEKEVGWNHYSELHEDEEAALQQDQRVKQQLFGTADPNKPISGKAVWKRIINLTQDRNTKNLLDMLQPLLRQLEQVPVIFATREQWAKRNDNPKTYRWAEYQPWINTILMGDFHAKPNEDGSLKEDQEVMEFLIRTLAEELQHAVLYNTIESITYVRDYGVMPMDYRGRLSLKEMKKFAEITQTFRNFLQTKADEQGIFRSHIRNEQEIWANYASDPAFREWVDSLEFDPQTRRKLQTKYQMVKDFIVRLLSRILSGFREASALDIMDDHLRKFYEDSNIEASSGAALASQEMFPFMEQPKKRKIEKLEEDVTQPKPPKLRFPIPKNLVQAVAQYISFGGDDYGVHAQTIREATDAIMQSPNWSKPRRETVAQVRRMHTTLQNYQEWHERGERIKFQEAALRGELIKPKFMRRGLYSEEEIDEELGRDRVFDDVGLAEDSPLYRQTVEELKKDGYSIAQANLVGSEDFLKLDPEFKKALNDLGEIANEGENYLRITPEQAAKHFQAIEKSGYVAYKVLDEFSILENPQATAVLEEVLDLPESEQYFRASSDEKLPLDEVRDLYAEVKEAGLIKGEDISYVEKLLDKAGSSSYQGDVDQVLMSIRWSVERANKKLKSFDDALMNFARRVQELVRYEGFEGYMQYSDFLWMTGAMKSAGGFRSDKSRKDSSWKGYVAYRPKVGKPREGEIEGDILLEDGKKDVYIPNITKRGQDIQGIEQLNRIVEDMDAKGKDYDDAPVGDKADSTTVIAVLRDMRNSGVLPLDGKETRAEEGVLNADATYAGPTVERFYDEMIKISRDLKVSFDPSDIYLKGSAGHYSWNDIIRIKPQYRHSHVALHEIIHGNLVKKLSRAIGGHNVENKGPEYLKWLKVRANKLSKKDPARVIIEAYLTTLETVYEPKIIAEEVKEKGVWKEWKERPSKPLYKSIKAFGRGDGSYDLVTDDGKKMMTTFMELARSKNDSIEFVEKPTRLDPTQRGLTISETTLNKLYQAWALDSGEIYVEDIGLDPKKMRRKDGFVRNKGKSLYRVPRLGVVTKSTRYENYIEFFFPVDNLNKVRKYESEEVFTRKLIRERKVRFNPDTGEEIEGVDPIDLVDSSWREFKKYGPYGLYNIDEFLTEAFTDKKFQEQLDKIPGIGYKSIWSQLIDAIKKLFGFTKESATILGDVLTASMDFMSERPFATGGGDTISKTLVNAAPDDYQGEVFYKDNDGDSWVENPNSKAILAGRKRNRGGTFSEEGVSNRTVNAEAESKKRQLQVVRNRTAAPRDLEQNIHMESVAVSEVMKEIQGVAEDLPEELRTEVVEKLLKNELAFIPARGKAIQLRKALSERIKSLKLGKSPNSEQYEQAIRQMAEEQDIKPKELIDEFETMPLRMRAVNRALTMMNATRMHTRRFLNRRTNEVTGKLVKIKAEADTIKQKLSALTDKGRYNPESAKEVLQEETKKLISQGLHQVLTNEVADYGLARLSNDLSVSNLYDFLTELIRQGVAVEQYTAEQIYEQFDIKASDVFGTLRGERQDRVAKAVIAKLLGSDTKRQKRAKRVFSLDMRLAMDAPTRELSNEWGKLRQAVLSDKWKEISTDGLLGTQIQEAKQLRKELDLLRTKLEKVQQEIKLSKYLIDAYDKRIKLYKDYLGEVYSPPVKMGDMVTLLAIDEEGNVIKRQVEYSVRGDGALELMQAIETTRKILRNPELTTKIDQVYLDYFNRVVTELGDKPLSKIHHASATGYLMSYLEPMVKLMSRSGKEGMEGSSALIGFFNEYRELMSEFVGQGQQVNLALEKFKKELLQKESMSDLQLRKYFLDPFRSYVENRPEVAEWEQAAKDFWNENRTNQDGFNYSDKARKLWLQYVQELVVATNKVMKASRDAGLSIETEIMIVDPLLSSISEDGEVLRPFHRREVPIGALTTPRFIYIDKIAKAYSVLLRGKKPEDRVINHIYKSLKDLADSKEVNREAVTAALSAFKGLDANMEMNFLDPLFSDDTNPRNVGYSIGKDVISMEEIREAWEGSEGKNTGAKLADMFNKLIGNELTEKQYARAVRDFVYQMNARAEAIIKTHNEITSRNAENIKNPDSIQYGAQVWSSLNAREDATKLPSSFFTYTMFTEMDMQRLLGKILQAKYFGRNREVLNSYFNEMAVALQQALGKYARIQSKYTDHRTRFEDIIPDISEDGKISTRLKLSRRAKRILSSEDQRELSKLHTEILALRRGRQMQNSLMKFMNSNDESPEVDTQAFLETIQTIAGFAVSNPKSALNNFAQMWEIVNMYGFSVPGGKHIYRVLKGMPREAAISLMESFGKTILRNMHGERELRRYWVDLKQSMPGRYATRGMEGELIDGKLFSGKSYRRLIRRLRNWRMGQGGVTARGKIRDDLKGVPGSLRTAVPFLGNPFAWASQALNKYTSLSILQDLHERVKKATAVLDELNIDPDDQTKELTPEEMGFQDTKLSRLVHGSYQIFERLDNILYENGTSITQLAQDYRRRRQSDRNAAVMTPEKMMVAWSIATHEISFDSSMAKSRVVQESYLGRTAAPLLGWATSRLGKTSELIRDNKNEGRISSKAITRLAYQFLGAGIPISMAVVLLGELYDEEVLGKESSLGKVSPKLLLPFGLPLAMMDDDFNDVAVLERLGRTSSIGGVAQELGTATLLGYSDQGRVPRDPLQRILFINLATSIMDVAGNLASTDGKIEYSSTIRPLMYATGLNGMIQAMQFATHVVPEMGTLPLLREERQVTDVISYRSLLRTYARALDVEVQKSGGGMNYRPTRMTLAIRKMERAAYANDRMGFMEAYREAKELSTAVNPSQDVIDRYRRRNLRAGISKYSLSDRDWQLLLSVMDEQDESKIMNAVSRHNYYLQLIGGTPSESRTTRQSIDALRLEALR